MSIYLIWLIAAVVLLIVEIMSQMVWTLCLAIGCLGAMCGELLGVSLAWQLTILGVLAVLSYIILVPQVKRWHERVARKRGSIDRTGMDALLGRRAIVTHEIRPGSIGRARIDGDNWQVVAPGVDYVIERGSEVSVSAYKSIILTVEPLRRENNLESED